MIGDRGQKARVWATILTGVTLALALGGAAPPTRAARLHESHGAAMGTVVSISVWTDDEATATAAMAAARAELDRLERLMTLWGDTSDVARVNAAAGDGRAIAVAPEVLEVLERAEAASRLSGGAFDVTVGSFAGLWKFDVQDEDGTVPTPAEVAARLPLVAHADVILDRAHGTVRLLRRGQKITLGGIAKGYAVDRAAAILRGRGLGSFLVQAGGDLYAAGRRGDRPWRVGVQDPRGPRGSIFAQADVEDHAFSTSGDYERFVLAGGRRYHHILDPRTGFPATACRQVTILAPDAVTAEVLTKTVFIWGPVRGFALLATLPGVEAVVVDAQNQVHVTPGLARRLTVLAPPTPGP